MFSNRRVISSSKVNNLWANSSAYFQCISSLASMLFKIIHLIQFISAEKSSVIIPWFWAILAFFADTWMICASGTRPGQQFFSFLSLQILVLLLYKQTFVSTNQVFSTFQSKWFRLLKTERRHFFFLKFLLVGVYKRVCRKVWQSLKV